ncbi:MAG: hypothetical protein K9K82_06275 [Desulfobacteraceae bacterium]|nr:hypothetical protein [Desulfobacteraceae bacterium]
MEMMMGMLFNWDTSSKKLSPRAFLVCMTAVTCLLFGAPQICISADVLETFQFEDRWPDASVDNMAYNAADNELYLAAGNFLVIMDAVNFEEISRLKIARNSENSEDITDPEEVVELSRGIIGLAAAPGHPEGSYVYAACGPQGIAVVKVSDPNNPVIETTIAEASQDDPIYGSAVDYDPDVQRLYVADVFHGLRCIDVNDTANLHQEWAYEQRTDWQDEEDEASGGHINVHIKETDGSTFAFVLDQLYGLRIFDVTNGAGPDGPADPLASFDMRSELWWGQYSEVVDVIADGGRKYAYVSDPTYGVTILDFSGIQDGGEITNVGQIETPGSASGVTLSDDNNTLFVADGNEGMLIADVTNPNTAEGNDPPDFPESLVEAETYAASGAYAVLAANGDTNAFLASGKDGLARLEKNGSFDTGNLQYEKTGEYNPPARITGLYVEGGYAYILDDGGPAEGLRILRLKDQDTDRPRLEGFIATGGSANAVAVYESFAYVADRTGGVAVIDITEKTNPQEMTGLGLGTVGDARDIKIYEQNDSVYAYIADNSGELIIAQVNKETGELTEKSSRFVSSAIAVAIYEQEEEGETSRYAAVVNGSALTIFNVTTPENPEERGSLGTGDSRDVAVTNLYGKQFAIVADGSNGIRLINISDPQSPEEQIGSGSPLATNGPAEAISLYGAYIHAAVGRSGIAVIGIEDKDPPELTPIDLDSADAVNPYYNTPGYASDVFVAEGDIERYTYIADDHGGFLALVHKDTLGGGINEQPFTESPDDSARIECFINSLF